MIYTLKKHRNIVVISIILALSFGAWYVLSIKNVNKIPERADLVFNTIIAFGDIVK